jgi:cyclophilin family peptidyl-prolyl cis-trans isomerase
MRHTIFGEVISGLEVVQKIENTRVDAQDRPIAQQKINRVYIKPSV